MEDEAGAVPVTEPVMGLEGASAAGLEAKLSGWWADSGAEAETVAVALVGLDL